MKKKRNDVWKHTWGIKKVQHEWNLNIRMKEKVKSKLKKNAQSASQTERLVFHTLKNVGYVIPGESRSFSLSLGTLHLVCASSKVCPFMRKRGSDKDPCFWDGCFPLHWVGDKAMSYKYCRWQVNSFTHNWLALPSFLTSDKDPPTLPSLVCSSPTLTIPAHPWHTSEPNWSTIVLHPCLQRQVPKVVHEPWHSQ